MCLAVPGRIESITGDDPLTRSARVSFGGVIKEVNLSCVPEAKVGDYVIVHVGFALSIVDEEEAKQVFQYLDQMEESVPASTRQPGHDTQTGPVSHTSTSEP